MSSEVVSEAPADVGYRVIPKDRLRRVTGKRMRASVTEKPHVTLHRYVAIDALLAWRKQEQQRLPESDRADVTLTAALVALVARALRTNNRLNGRIEEEEIRLYDVVHVGVATEVPGGLVVPVIRDAADRGVAEIGAELKRLAAIAREGRLRPEDMSEGTFTISNLGSYGVELFTPIINPPQLAILGVGASTQVVTPRGGEFVVTTRLGLSLSFDHAASDGSDAARVLEHLVRALESPDADAAGRGGLLGGGVA